MRNFLNYIKRFNFTRKIKIIAIVVGFFMIYSITLNVIVKNRNKSNFKPIVSFIVNHSLTNNCNNKNSCDELRPLPKILQNKKIVFNKNVNIKFDPYENINNIGFSELDILGFIDTEPVFNGEVNFVDPTLGRPGFLEEREYKIVRAVYSYKCSYCIDSDDLAYLVLEDSKENRFMVFFQTYDSSVTPVRNFLWDEYLPYFLSKDSDGKKTLDARLEDV